MTTVAATHSELDAAPRRGRPEISPAVRASVELLDQRFRVPILGVRFGMDAILGLIRASATCSAWCSGTGW